MLKIYHHFFSYVKPQFKEIVTHSPPHVLHLHLHPNPR
jgi:hypothetical protein